MLEQRLRHVIEYTQENNTRNENENELIKKKLILYSRVLMLQIRVEQMNAGNIVLNSS